jgi:flagellar hook-associated protein 3 FlgL
MKVTGSSDLGRLTALKRSTAETRAALANAGTEMTTGLNTSRYDATSGNITRIFAIERALDRNEVFGDTIALTEVRVDTAQNALGLMLTPLQDLSASLPSAVSMGDTQASLVHARSARNALTDTISALNTQSGGLSLFAGTATDGPAVAPAATILADLDALAAAAATPADAIASINAYFAPGGAFLGTRYLGSATDLAPVDVGEGRRIDYALRADAGEFVDALRSEALAAVVAGGAFAGDIDAQMEMLSAAGTAMLTSKEGILDLRSAVGVTQQALEDAKAARTAEKDTLDLARNAIMTVDPTEAASVYQALETQLQTIFTVTARLSDLSYVKYM